MSPAAGTRIGPYEVLAPLGAGGMGEVWRARDPRLGRDVAIKALPAEFARDPERLARFEREARLLASLSHPGIAGIHGVEESDGARYLVLEFVDGETLADRLARGPLPVDDAVDVARQMAAALEAAHESGVIHRDLKPGNVMLGPGGVVKVLDFGLARAGADNGDPSLSTSPTRTHAATAAGMILGTAAYMSPEQARGKPVDRRTDLWSFGCVLYECLTGRATFEGETVSDLIAKILQTEPDWSALPAATPPRLRELLERCLRRDPKDRQRDMGDARLALEEIARGGGTAAIAAKPPRLRHQTVSFQVAMAIVTAVVGVLASRLIDWGPPPPLNSLAVMLPAGQRLEAGLENNVLAVSPDGRAIAYCAQAEGPQKLHYRRLDSRVTTELAGTENARNPFFSPDGEWIAFFAARTLRKVSVRGGTPVELAPSTGARGGTWLENGDIVYSPSYASPLMRIPGGGGQPRAVTTVDTTRDERTHRFPLGLPGGEWVVFTVGVRNSPGSYEDAAIDAVSLKTGERRHLATGSCARYVRGGHLIVARSGSLYAQPLDPRNPRGGGTPVPVFDGVMGEPTSGAVYFDIARNGTLVLVPGQSTREDSRLAWVDLAGKRTELPVPERPFIKLDLSPDGRRALASAGPGGGSSDVLLVDLERGAISPLTSDRNSGTPLWWRDGRGFAFARGRGNGSELVTRRLDAADSGRVIARHEHPIQLHSITPDGRAVLYSEFGVIDSDLLEASLDGSSPPRTIVGGTSTQAQGVISPDGRWIAYVDAGNGQQEVVVRPMGRPGLLVPVSTGGAGIPMWAPDGRTLYYSNGATLVGTPLDVRGDEIVPGETRRIFDLAVSTGDGSVRDVAIHPSGQKFLVRVSSSAHSELREIAVILGWAESLKGRAKPRS